MEGNVHVLFEMKKKRIKLLLDLTQWLNWYAPQEMCEEI